MTVHPVAMAPGRAATRDAVAASRLHTMVALVGVILFVLVLGGSLLDGSAGSISYVASLGATALVVLFVAVFHRVQAQAWRLVGIGLTGWAATGFLVVLKYEVELTAIPDLVIYLGYTVSYLPCLFGFAELADGQLRVRRWSGLADGLLVFLVLYGVLWLLVVEPYAYNSDLPQLDRAFSALYPAGDIALVMLAVRIWTSRAARRRVAVLLVTGSSLTAMADLLLLIDYLVNPDGSYVLPDVLYLGGLSVLGVAAMWSLLPAPPPVTLHQRGTRRMPLLVTAAAVVPAVLLLGIATVSDRSVEVVPVALWVTLLVLVLVVRSVAGARALERAHQQALWMASHDLSTGALRRQAFHHEISEGGLRDRSGTVIVIEVLGLQQVADQDGLDAVDQVLEATAARLRATVGTDAVFARLANERFVVFLRAGDLGRGRQVAHSLERALAEGVAVGGGVVVQPHVVGGVAQADGAVIDVDAGVRRATAAMRRARTLGTTRLLFDADLAGVPEDPSSGVAV